MRCDSITFSGHAITRMFERGLSKNEVVNVIHNGETASNYPEDQPFPSRLLLDWAHKKPVHVVVASDEKDYDCYVVTAYIPSTHLWNSDFKTRKQ